MHLLHCSPLAQSPQQWSFFSCPGSGVSPGILHSLVPGVWGINFQELPSGPAWAHPLVRPFGSHWITMAWIPGLDHHCHCLLCKMTRRKEYYGFVKLPQELSRACAYWDLLLYPGLLSFPGIFMSILTLFGSKRNVPLLFPQHLWCLSDICFAVFLTQLTSAQEGARPNGAQSFTSLSFNWIISQEAPSKLALSQKSRACCETLLPENSSYCLILLLKLSRERHTFQRICGCRASEMGQVFQAHSLTP